MGENKDGKAFAVSSISPTVITKIGRNSLQELRNFHQIELDEEYLGFWDRYGIDREYGGFMPNVDADGNYTSTDKAMYYQGRGIWVFSYLYNHFGKNDRHLEAARLCKDFIYKHCRKKDSSWISLVNREGKPVKEWSNIYGDMYVVLGLSEYYKATGDETTLDIARETAHSINTRILSPAYQHLKTGGYTAGHKPGVKRLGTWQHFLGSLTSFARYKNDYGIEMMARMCVRNIMERHYHPDSGLMYEYLDDLFQPFGVDSQQENRFVSGWHSIQSAYMCMDEALRTGNTKIFHEAMEMGRSTLKKCWVDGDRGGLVDLPYPEAEPLPPETGESYSGAMDDALVFCLLAVEHTHSPWAVSWFDKIFTHGYTKPERWKRSCLLHHPRRLFFCIEILDRMIARNGRVSNFCDT